jgi:hypothetical protein
VVGSIDVMNIHVENSRAKRAGAMGGSDGTIAEPRAISATPEDECPHDDFAELRVGLHQREEMLAVHLDDVALLHRAHVHQ